MGDSKLIQECEDCQRLIKVFKREDLNVCERCGHLYPSLRSGDCNCKGE